MTQQRQSLLYGEEGAAYVDVEDSIEMFLRNGTERNDLTHACIGEYNIEVALGAFDGFVKTIEVFQLGDVALNARDVATNLCNGRIEFSAPAMHTFARAVETGSFSAVAREYRIGQPNVSRQIAKLEEYLGTRLLHRSTRKLTLTPEGQRYYEEARRVLDAVEEAESNARGEDRPHGLLRVACPTALARTHVLPWIKSVLDSYPGIALDLQIGDRFIDLIEEGVDLAIRIGLLKDSALKARRIGTAERVCVASPQYLKTHSMPHTPADLMHHDCIVYSLAQTGDRWTFQATEVAVNGRRATVFMEAIAEKFSGEPVLNEGALRRLLRTRRSARPRG